ncbi:MAG: hypothetical protein DI566_05330 [Microbacterium sp.]|nr:MAG: hypothetical protein DI566_05330 [Microbacterium sp.]
MTTTPTYTPQPEPDTRTKGIAWTALSLAIAGVVLTLIGFVPVPWVGIIAVVLGGIVLLAAFVFSIVGLAGKRFGGKPLSITALVVSIVGGVLGVIALAAALVITGNSVAQGIVQDSGRETPSVTEPSDAADDDATTDDTADDSALTANETAFLAQVRPEVNRIMAEIDPSITPDIVEATFDDATLITVGEALLTTGQAGVDSFAEQSAGTEGAADAELMRSLYQAIYDAAVAHLQ